MEVCIVRKSSKILFGSVICMIVGATLATKIEESSEPSWVLYWLCAAVVMAALFIGLSIGYIERSRENGKPKKWPYMFIIFGTMGVFVCFAGMLAPEEMLETTHDPIVTATIVPVHTPVPTAAPTHTSVPTATPVPTPTSTPVVYTEVTVESLYNDLRQNAYAASVNHNEQYHAVRGKIGTIDSSGKYFVLEEASVEYWAESVHCSIKSEQALQDLATVITGEVVTVYGKITTVGEILGYYMDAYSIAK